MNDGVKILLERMKTHPEEFYSNVTGKWAHIINTYKPYLNDEDTKYLQEGIDTLMQQRFTEEVLGELVDPKDGVSLKSVAHPRNTLSATPAPSPSIPNMTLEHMKAHLEALQVKDRKELINKKPTTIFGKLFNYQ